MKLVKSFALFAIFSTLAAPRMLSLIALAQSTFQPQNLVKLNSTSCEESQFCIALDGSKPKSNFGLHRS